MTPGYGVRTALNLEMALAIPSWIWRAALSREVTIVPERRRKDHEGGLDVSHGQRLARRSVD